MKGRSRIACISAAALAAIYSGSSLVKAADLSWDLDPGTPGVQNGGNGTWNTTDPFWWNGAANVAWNNANLDSAFFGSGAGTFNPVTANNGVIINAGVVVQNINLGVADNGGSYDIIDVPGGSLTLAGNIEKSSSGGALQLGLENGLNLTAGQHTFIIRDTGGDAPELTINAEIKGTGGVTLNNGSYDQWGTLVHAFENSYSGGTRLQKGRLVINGNNRLGTGSVTISDAGALSFYGAQSEFQGDVTVSNAINITRNTYSGAGFDNYQAAIISTNTGNANSVMTFNGPFTIDSTDARVQADTSRIVIASDIQQGSANPSTLTVTGDFAGFVSLTGNNTALQGGIRLQGGVQLEVTNQNNLGGPSSPLTFAGSATLRPVGGFLTNWGSHVLNTGSFNGGLYVDDGQTFTFDRDITGGGSIGKRGPGTLNMPMTYNVTGGQSFYDAGTVNFTGTGTSNLHSIHMRSATLNVSSGTITTTNNYSAIGQDSTGTNGGPDKSTVNIFGTGAIVAGTEDFNLSDNANTAGTVNLSGNGYLSVGGTTYLGKSSGAAGTMTVTGNSTFTSSSLVFVGQNNGVGTVLQSGGNINLTRTGNFTFVLGDGRNGTNAKGYYNLSGGTFTSAGEVFVGQGNNTGVPGVGTWVQSAGVANVNNWFVVGREGGLGTVDLSGTAVLNKGGGGNFAMGDSNNPIGGTNLMTVRGNAVVNQTGGQFFVGNNGGAKGVLNIQDSASVTVNNNWLAVGRNGGTGTVNLVSGTLAKTGAGDHYFTIGSGGTGTVNVTGGTLNSSQTFVGERDGAGTLLLSGGTVNLGTAYVRLQGSAQGNLIMSNGRLTTGALTNAGNIALSGGTQTFGAIGNGTINVGQGSMNLSGTALATADSVRQPTVSMAGSSRLTINANGTETGTSRIGTLSVTDSAKLDLNNNDLIVVNGGAAPVQSLINSGRNGGSWNGVGITSSAAAAATPKNTTLGVLTGAEYSSVGGTGTFSGLAYAPTDVLVKYTYYGDTDFNGQVNFDDYSRIDAGFNLNRTGWLNGDFDANGGVNFDDYALIDLAFNTQGGTLIHAMNFLEGEDRDYGTMNTPELQVVVDHFAEFGNGYATSFLQAVPEPSSTLGLAGVAVGAMIRRRRRNK